MSVDRPNDSQLVRTPVDFDPFAGEREHQVLPLTAPQQEVWTAERAVRHAGNARKIVAAAKEITGA